jgi:putative transposase
LTDSSGATGVALATCLLVASALRLAVSAVARKVAGAGRETVRKAIAASLPQDPRQLELRIAAGLRRAIPRQGGRRSVPVAIDFHQRPYYGQRARTPGVVGGKAERGARWFWSYATAVSLRRGRRYTLAITSVEASDTFTTVVERLLAQVSWSGVRVRYVLLDRAFYAVGVVNALRRRGLRFIIPMVRRGKAAKKFFRRGCRGWFDHTFESRRREEGKASVRVAVVPGPDGNRPLVFACSEGFNALPDVVLRYRRRFGIETSYRQLGECLAVTTSRDVVYRLLLVGVSLLIRAWWVVSRGVTLGAIRWDLIVEFTTTQQRTPATQTAPPQQHAPT